ncbi:TraR/DksA C4-type zinc finger protein [Sulfurovum sp.]|uniref:TraR/DksA family transcriptional regulator n=1 Tax=Sulfurovum sp. TaxID=1969726 RepID=UPI0025F9917A|nr:TraR/DksA C4-type zinc finger protein [Sulfurovum sp.]
MKKRNDLDLDKFEKILTEHKIQLEENIAQLKSELDEVGSDDGINDVEDLVSLKNLSQKDNTILEQQEKELKETLHALAKINNGTYGICEKSAKPIPVERLEIMPTARYIVGVED